MPPGDVATSLPICDVLNFALESLDRAVAFAITVKSVQVQVFGRPHVYEEHISYCKPTEYFGVLRNAFQHIPPSFPQNA